MAVRTISTKITLEGETEFKKQMEEIDSNLRTLNTELKASEAQFLDAADSEEALADKSSLLTQKVEQQRAKLEALRKMLQDVQENHADNAREVDSWRKKVATAEIALYKMERQLGETEEALEDVRRPTDRAAEAFDELRDKVVSAVPALGSVGGALGLAAKGALGIAAVGAAGSAAIAGIGLAAGAGAIAIANLAKAAAEEGNPAFDGLTANLEALNGASSAAKAALGQILLPALEDLSGRGGELLSNFTSDMAAAGDDTGAISGVISDYVVQGAQLLADAVPGMMQQGFEMIQAIGEGAVEGLPILLEAAGGILDALTSGILDDPNQVSETVEALITSFMDFVGEHGPQLMEAGPVLIAALLNGITASLGNLSEGGGAMVSELVLSLLRGLPDMTSSGLKLLLAVLTGLVKAVPDLVAEVPGIINEMLAAFGSAIVEFIGLGGAIVNNIIQGIFNNEDTFVGQIGGWIRGLVSRLAGNAADGISGGPAIGGVGRHATGLDYVPYDEYPAVLHKGERVLTAAENRRYSSGDTGAGKVVNITINAPHIGPDEEQHLLDLINREFGGP